jgi:ABC-2 type transport system ATP-binding protein
LMPAAAGFYPRLPVRQNLALYADLYGLAAERVEAVLAEVGLADQTQQRVGDLPVGLAQRLAFGRAILHQPAVLLLIDPFAECDTASIALLHRLIQAQAAADTAVLLVSGETVGLTRLCQTIYVFDGGRLSHQYRPDDPPKENSLPFKIPARLEGKVALINPGDILYATTDEGQTVLCTADGPIPTHFTLTELETRLAHSGFFRAHRSYLVNLQQVKEVIAYTRDSFSLILENSREEIPLSKGAAKELREVLGY